ncbi:MAG: glycosyltransferase family 4 protein [Chloroflexi bacterium]|nr:glycosyltransferase family 4 protein [Chloroflexota bacterium]
MIKATFVMEQHIGHRSYYENLRGFIDAVPHLEASWVEITYEQPGAIWNRWPLLPESIRGTLSGRKQVREGLRQNRADVALFNTQVPGALGGQLTRRQPYVLCTDITPIQYDQMAEHYYHQPDRDGFLSRYKQRINTQLFQGAARILPWSNWVRDSLINDYGVASSRIEVVPPGVDTEKWHPQRKPHDGPLRVLFIGGDFYRKGGEYLLAAAQLLPPGLVEFVLVTRSSVPEGANMTTYGNMQPNSPELIALSQSCDAFVLPTKAEAFGIAAVEATALGLPVIGTAVGGLTDIVADGETGFLIPPSDAPALASRLRRLAEDSDLRRRFGRAARERAKNHFDARKNAARVVAILEEIVKGSTH